MRGALAERALAPSAHAATARTTSPKPGTTDRRIVEGPMCTNYRCISGKPKGDQPSAPLVHDSA